MSNNDKILLFQPRQFPFFSNPRNVFTGGLLMALVKAGLLVMR